MRTLPLVLALALLACSAPRAGDDTSGTGGAPDAGNAGNPGAPDAGGGTAADPCATAGSAPTDAAAYDAVLACLRSPAAEAAKRTAIAGFATLVEGRGGFPISDGLTATFVYLHDSAWDPAAGAHNGALQVAGDFDAWQGGVSLADEGLGFEHAKVPLATATVATDGAKYKFRTGDGTYFADPLARRFQFDGFGEFSLLAGEPGRSHLERIRSVHATKLNVDRPIHLYVPAGYEASQDRYPVLYMHDGQNLFDPSISTIGAAWEADAVADDEIAGGRVKPFLIVGVPNDDNRFGEYTWTTDVLEGQTVGGQGADYADFLVHELKPIVDARYRTKPGREDTAILGSSLGGLISYEIGLAFPDVFRFVGGMSSTFDWGRMGSNQPTALDRYRASVTLPASDQAFYLDSGGSIDGCPGSGGDNACETLEMKGILESKGYVRYPEDPNAAHYSPADADILHWLEPGAVHNEDAWHKRLFRAYRFFFGR